MIGETVGAYLIERRLGEGGMGIVYGARHTGVGRRAALKVLHQDHPQKRANLGDLPAPPDPRPACADLLDQSGPG